MARKFHKRHQAQSKTWTASAVTDVLYGPFLALALGYSRIVDDETMEKVRGRLIADGLPDPVLWAEQKAARIRAGLEKEPPIFGYKKA